MQAYSFREGETIVKEMTDLLCLDLVEKEMITPSLTLYVGYSNALHLPAAKGTVKLDVPSSSDKILVPAAAALYGRIVDPQYPVRRISITCNQVVADDGVSQQMSMFEEQGTARRDKRLQQIVLDIKKKYGKNSILKGLNYTPEATTRERNLQIGGHKSGDEA